MKLEVGVWWMEQDEEQIQGWKEEKLDNIILKIGYFHTNIYHYIMSNYHFNVMYVTRNTTYYKFYGWNHKIYFTHVSWTMVLCVKKTTFSYTVKGKSPFNWLWYDSFDQMLKNTTKINMICSRELNKRYTHF
jgi:hypothetical protein